MIDISGQLKYHLSNLDEKQTRLSFQASTGRVLENGSDDAILFSRVIDIESKLREQNGIKRQVDKTIAQGNVADGVLNEMKLTLDNIKVNILKSVNSGVPQSVLNAIATDIKGFREDMIRQTNTKLDGEYVFSGSKISTQSFTKDANFNQNGKVVYQGDAQLRDVPVSPNAYKDKGVHGIDIFTYTNDTSDVNNTISFQSTERVFDTLGFEWQLNTVNSRLEKLDEDGNVSNDFLILTNDGNNPATYTSENITAAANISAQTQAGLRLETKHNFFDDLNIIINALEGFSTDTSDGPTNGQRGAPITLENAKDLLRGYIDTTDRQIDATNTAHASLGSKNKIFENFSSSIDAQITHFNILIQETDGVDFGQVALESKALEITYSSLYSTINRLNQLSLVNYLR